MSQLMIREITDFDDLEPSSEHPARTQIQSEIANNAASLTELELKVFHKQHIIDAFYTEFFRQCIDEDSQQPLLAKDEYVERTSDGALVIKDCH